MWSEPVDAYCERLDPSFWAEPVNAVTNLAFLVAAALMAARVLPARDRGALLLCAILALIGTGSFLFHTVAVRWSALADVVPILAFILAYVFLAARRFLGWRVQTALLPALAYIPVSAGTAGLVGFATGGLGGSEGYLGVLVYIAGFALLLRRRDPATARGLLAGGAIFTASLAARTLDGPLCAAIPLGTHFLWHILNAVMLGWMIAVLAARPVPPPRTARPAP